MSEQDSTPQSEQSVYRENQALRQNLVELTQRITELHAQILAPPPERPVTFRVWLRFLGRRWLRKFDAFFFGRNR